MNERIKELLKESELQPYYDAQAEQIEKFAGLIVRECLVQISEAIPDTNCSASGVYNTAKLAATSRVKEHFGVE